MNRRAGRVTAAVAVAGLLSVPTLLQAHAGTTGATPAASASSGTTDLGRDVLADGDGWASSDGGTTGGSAADADHVFTVDTTEELRTAVAGDEPKIVYVTADLDANTTADGTTLTCEDYAQDGYTFEDYLAAYDPAVWGANEASGELEDARAASETVQGEQIRVDIGGNTTLVGVGDVTLSYFSLRIKDVDNVIVRNLTVSDAYDCFPSWAGDEWNTEWDNLVVYNSTHVWIDHATLDDGEHDDTGLEALGEHLVHHDGLLDVVRAADLVTVSWSVFADHDKSLLFGNSDSRTTDRGAIRVTMHHNLFTGLNQRAPRLRFGQVLVYDNVYEVTDADDYSYSWGLGVESSLFARDNAFELDAGVTADQLVADWGGTGLDEEGTLVDGVATDVLAAFQAANPGSDVTDTVTGEIGPHLTIEDAATAAVAVHAGAGAGTLS